MSLSPCHQSISSSLKILENVSNALETGHTSPFGGPVLAAVQLASSLTFLRGTLRKDFQKHGERPNQAGQGARALLRGWPWLILGALEWPWAFRGACATGVPLGRLGPDPVAQDTALVTSCHLNACFWSHA